MGLFNRITQNPEQMGGKPCLRGMRVTVGMIVNLIANGCTDKQILSDFPYLEADDIREALRYAAWRSEEREIPISLA